MRERERGSRCRKFVLSRLDFLGENLCHRPPPRRPSRAHAQGHRATGHRQQPRTTVRPMQQPSCSKRPSGGQKTARHHVRACVHTPHRRPSRPLARRSNSHEQLPNAAVPPAWAPHFPPRRANHTPAARPARTHARALLSNSQLTPALHPPPPPPKAREPCQSVAASRPGATPGGPACR